TVIRLRHLGDDLRDAPLSLAGQAAVLLSGDPVLDVEMPRPSFRHLPALPRIVTTEDVVGRIVYRPEVRTVDRLHQIDHALRIVAVDVVLVLVQQPYAGFLGAMRLLCHPCHDFAAPLRPVVALRLVITEDADIRGVEYLAQLDGSLEALQVRLERLID